MGVISFAVVGHDGRQQAAGVYLQEKGYQVYSADEVHLADYILLPMPLSSDNISLAQLLKAAKPGAIAFAGKVSSEAKNVAADAQIEIVDYLEREELAVLNAIPTAEGALEILLRECRHTLWGNRVLVLGYGRIGKLLCKNLVGIGAVVTVAARTAEARAMAQGFGCGAIDFLALNQLSDYPAVVNTVPKMVLGARQLVSLPKGAFVLDLASDPGGVDFKAAEMLHIKTQHALSLPARCAPQTAGGFVAQTVLQILSERGLPI
ncbi:MAG: dipicolinic acid synthetase [Oscillospiraceae bacterium]|nr:dipicolinic acid synthetase [Oscillospiraceae bacterium]